MGWMGPVVDGQEHEGWVVPLFADGAQGAGASNARGVLVARRPDDGPRSGDRARLTDYDGSAVEGIWQDTAVIGHAGMVDTDTGGSLRCQVIDEVESDAPTRRWSAGSPAAPAGYPVGPGPHVRAGRPGSAVAGRARARGPIWRQLTKPGSCSSGGATSPDGRPSRKSIRPRGPTSAGPPV